MEINFTDGVLRINGADVKDRPVVVCVPGPDGWTNRKLFNPNLVSGEEETLDKLEVSYTAAEKEDGMESNAIYLKAHVDTDKAMEQTRELMELLKKASSLADELANTLNGLEVSCQLEPDKHDAHNL